MGIKGINSGSSNGSWKVGLCSLTHPDDLLQWPEERRFQAIEFLTDSSRVTKNSTECWNWNGATLGGYPRIGGGLVHRLIYVLFYEEPIGDLYVCHKCDNPICINPSHLFVGDHQDNVDDQVSKKRQCYGEYNGRAILTEDKVRRIKALYRTKKYTQTELGKMFGAGQNTISKIVTGKQWRHVDA